MNSPLKFIAAACEYPEPKPVELGFYVDQHNPDLVLPGADYAVHGPSSSMIRHSPRLAGASPVYEFDILLYCGVEKNTATGKLVTIRQVNPEDNLKKIKQRVREKVHVECIRAGFYWVLKGKKQCCSLEDDSDSEKAKEAYTVKGEVKGIRLALCMLQEQPTSTGVRKGKAGKAQAKRSLSFPDNSLSKTEDSSKSKHKLDQFDDDSGDKDEERFQKYLNDKAKKGEAEGKKKDKNKLWNDIFVDLVRFLESKGTKPRFAQEHLCLWADLMADGRAEREKEPNWQHLGP